MVLDRNKIINIFKISNPEIVLNNAKIIYGNDVMIGLSNRKSKKFQIFNPNTDKWFHFGSEMMDYTVTKDEVKRRNFLNRNHKWKGAETYTPAFASYWLLWHIL